MNAQQGPATKADLLEFQERLFGTLQGHFAVSEQRTQQQIAALDQGTQQRFPGLEQRFSGLEQQLAGLEQRIQEQFVAADLHMREHVEAVETRLLIAFQQRAVPINGRPRKLEAGDGLLDERLAMTEEQIMTIERRLGPPPQRM